MERLIISPKQSRNCATILCFLAIFIGISGVAGWLFNIPIITTFLLNRISMKFNTAICLILSGMALWLLCPKKISKHSRIIAAISAILILAISTATLCQDVFGIDLGIDQFFFIDTQGQPYEVPGRMVIVVAINFVLIASSLLCMQIEKFPAWSYQVFQCIMFPLTLIAFVLLIYDIKIENKLLYAFQLSWPTIIAMFALNVAFIMAKPETGIGLILLQDMLSSKFARVTLPFLFIVPVVSNYLIRGGIKYHLYDNTFADAFTALLSIDLLSILLFINLFIIRKMETKESVLKEELSERKILLNEFVDNVDVVLWRTTPNLDKIIYVSPAYKKIWGRSLASLYEHPDSWLDAIVTDDKQKVVGAFQKMVDENLPRTTVEYKILNSNGLIRNIYDSRFLLKDPEGSIIAMLGVASDVTEVYMSNIRKYLIHDIHMVLSSGDKIEFAAREVMALICQALNFDIGELWLLNKEDNTLDNITVWHRDESLNKAIVPIIALTEKNKDDFRVICFSQNLVQYSTHPQHIENAYKSKDGKNHGLKECFGIPMRVKDIRLGAMVFYNCRLTEQSYDTYDLLKYVVDEFCKFIQATDIRSRLDYIENYDLMTGLYNRSAFETRLNNLIKSNVRSIAILKVKFVNWANINDAMGYDIGNKLLQQLAIKLMKYLRSNDDIVALIGYGRFGFLFQELDFTSVTNLANAILQITKLPVRANSHDIYIKLNIAVSFYPENGITVHDLLSNANMALSEADKEGTNLVKFASEETKMLVEYQVKIENDVARALKNNEFEMYYQPKISLETGKITSVEALIRWRDPDDGIRMPSDFIPVCERSGMIIELGEWVLRRSMLDMLKCKPMLPVAVNLSLLQFTKSYDLVRFIREVASELNFNLAYLELELTETILMSDPQRVLEVLTQLIQIDIKIDDFGTGYSSFSYLKTYSPDMIKIAKEFIDNIPNDQRSVNITHAIIALAHALGIKVIAEGVETEQQVKALKEAKCDEIQGFYFSKALPSHELRIFLKKNQVNA